MKSRTTGIESKICECGGRYFRKKGTGSDKQWDKRRYCSPKCSVKFFSSERQKILWANPMYQKKMSLAHIGQVAWNKGMKGIGRDEKNGMWKGELTQYGPKHAWVIRNKEKPESCEHCGIREKKLDWANKDHKYKRNLNDYMALCRSCHRKYDKKLRNES